MKKFFLFAIFFVSLAASTLHSASSFAQTSIYKAAITGPAMASQRVSLTYRAIFDSPAPVSGEVVISIPFPVDDETQQVEKYSFGSAMTPEKLLSISLQRDAVYGNRFWEIRVLNPALNDELTFDYVISRKEKANPLDVPIKADARILPAENRFVEAGDSAAENEIVAQATKNIVQPKMSRDEQIEAIYRYAISQFSADAKTEEINDLVTVLARANGVPAKSEFGVLIPIGREEGAIDGAHSWANLYHPQRGWIPTDAFEGARSKRFADYYLGRVGADRIAFAVGREAREYSGPRARLAAPKSAAVPMKLEISFKRLPSLTPMVTKEMAAED